MSSSRERARAISSIAAAAFFFLIILQVPLFRVPCRIGMCTTPMQVTSSQLFATEIFPQSVVKALLYPGAVANAFLMSKTIPSYDDLLDAYNFANSKAVSSAIDLRRIEVLAGSYLMVAGALLSLMKPVRMSFFGALLVIWGLAREVMLGKTAYSNSSKSIRMYPTLFFAAVSAFASMRKDVRKIVRMCRTRKSIWID
ncbi:uncharacterized protein LOC115737460 isoform X1 [Rhodamnia argentea]|uniref:Uncharacterized protein LOC115737460 n=2 Tax=Rhodamnia argentea TaxID=178133 RepID=A0A8B8NUB5_9MYRT|nr:uncharacterized protein LOC115737460 isoform X1 [Rhodamnia argentea]XP_048129724.1 uncharacterized protein LOC115737460 isoform X1 [Rhodamnia argentea]XP_048129726.1 uncharacterized protein LOC115737460 isoform X1 [Rhodamnia argentea]